MGVRLVEDRLGKPEDTRTAEGRRATLEFATDLWDCRDAVLALFMAGDVETLRQIAEAQPARTFVTSTGVGERARKAEFVAAFVAGDVDELGAAGCYMHWKARRQHAFWQSQPDEADTFEPLLLLA